MEPIVKSLMKIESRIRFKYLKINFFFVIAHIVFSILIPVYFDMVMTVKNILILTVPFLFLSLIIYIPAFYIDYVYCRVNSNLYIFDENSITVSKSGKEEKFYYSDISEIILNATPKKINNSWFYNASHEDYFYYEICFLENNLTLTCLLGDDLEKKVNKIIYNQNVNLIINKRIYPTLARTSCSCNNKQQR